MIERSSTDTHSQELFELKQGLPIFEKPRSTVPNEKAMTVFHPTSAASLGSGQGSFDNRNDMAALI